MGDSIQWKYRKQFVKRGKRMLLANWRNRCDNETLSIWWKRHVYRYAAWTSGPRIKNNLDRIEERYWLDVEKAIDVEYDLGLFE